MNILLAIKGFDHMPEIESDEPLHIIFSKDSTVPAIMLVSMLNKKNIMTYFLDDKHCDNIAIAIMIGRIVAIERDNNAIVYCPSEDQVKAFDGIMVDDVHITAKKIPNIGKSKRATGTSRKRQSEAAVTVDQEIGENGPLIQKDETLNKTNGRKVPTLRGRKITDPENKIRCLVQAGIDGKYADIVLDAIENSSDVEIGFGIQLKTKLAAQDALEALPDIQRIVTKELYKKLK